jgi:Protein of unknown function (DUF2934)
MARSKSIPGSKTSGSKANKSHLDVPAASAMNSVAATESEVAPALTAQVSDSSTGGSTTQGEHLAGSSGNSEPKVNSDGRKFEVMKSEVMKTDSRKNLVPINLEDEIRRRAYEIYEQRGVGSGTEADDWFTAEREVRQRYRQQTA